MKDFEHIPPVEITRPDGGLLPENHHLEWRPEKKTFRLKVTVNADGGRFVGKRVVVPLHTRDPRVARLMRDVAITVLSKAGVLARPVVMSELDGKPGGDDFSTGEK